MSLEVARQVIDILEAVVVPVRRYSVWAELVGQEAAVANFAQVVSQYRVLSLTGSYR